MRWDFALAVIMAGCLSCFAAAGGAGAHAQSPAGGNAAGAGSATGQSKPAANEQKPAGAPQPGAGSQTGTNPFPEDTSTVPVMPTRETPALPEGANGSEDYGRVALPGDDLDPVRSPDDAAPSSDAGQASDSSSSLAGLDKLLPKPDDDQPDRKGRRPLKEPAHQETAASDIDVGKYYLQTKNWRAARSRFESAMVLDPDNPEVYWGLAETERHLGDFAQARTHYQKLLDYDPEGPHGKEARKALADPQIANAKSAATVQAAPEAAK